MQKSEIVYPKPMICEARLQEPDLRYFNAYGAYSFRPQQPIPYQPILYLTVKDDDTLRQELKDRIMQKMAYRTMILPNSIDVRFIPGI